MLVRLAAFHRDLLAYHHVMSCRCAKWLGYGVSAVALAILPAVYPAEADDEVVDVELVLAVDVSLSMSPEELVIQRDGYAAALTEPVVLNAIADGAHGKIAVTYVEWAGQSTQHIIVPWKVISSPADAAQFVRLMTASPPRSARRTSIAAALDFTARLFDDSGFRGTKRVIDVSGDGPNNQGDVVEAARNRVTSKGITINGLPLMTNRNGMITPYDISNLDDYYADCVIGGPGAFMIPVNSWSQFPEAIRRKLVLELAGAGSGWHVAMEAAQPPVVRAAAEVKADCLIGEKIWQNRGWIDLP
jgi:hypothetical protein